MTNPQFGFPELAAAQSQPEVTVNAADRAITRAVAGEITIDFASDADYSLQATNPPASDDEWAYGTIIMTDTGNVLTTARSVIFPDVDSLYSGTSRLRFEFVNETAQALTIKGSGQTGVTVNAGSKALVRWNGTDVEEVAAAGGGGGGAAPLIPIQVAASEFGTPLEDGISVAYFRAPFAAVIEEVRASLLVPNTSGDIEIDIKVAGTTILDSPLVIDEGEKSSTTSTSPVDIKTNAAMGDDDEVTFDVEVPTGADAESLIVTLLVRPSS